MSARPPTKWESEGRARKVQRFVAEFNKTAANGDEPTPAVAAEIVNQLTAATEAQWKQLAEGMQEPKPPSPTTRGAIIHHYQRIANSAHLAGPEDGQEPGRERYEVSGDVDGRPYRVTVRNEHGQGFTWSLYSGEKFLRGGYTRGTDVLKAFGEARELFRQMVTPAEQQAGGL